MDSSKQKNLCFGTSPEVNAALAESAREYQIKEELLEGLEEIRAAKRRKPLKPQKFVLKDTPSSPCAESQVVCRGDIPYEDHEMRSSPKKQVCLRKRLFQPMEIEGSRTKKVLAQMGMTNTQCAVPPVTNSGNNKKARNKGIHNAPNSNLLNRS